MVHLIIIFLETTLPDLVHICLRYFTLIFYQCKLHSNSLFIKLYINILNITIKMSIFQINKRLKYTLFI